MNIVGLVLIIVIVILLSSYIKGHNLIQVGSADLPVTLKNDSNFTRQYRELDNVDNVLNRPIREPNEAINNLKAVNTFDKYKYLKHPPAYYLDFTDIKCIPASKDTNAIVEAKQPYFLDEALIIKRDGRNFYYDWRYPKKPIPVEFAKNPEKFIKQNPNVYPSYIIKSRDLSGLKPYDPWAAGQ